MYESIISLACKPAGPAVTVHSQWHITLDSWQSCGQSQPACAFEVLLTRRSTAPDDRHNAQLFPST